MLCGVLTLHARTAIHHAAMLTGARFRVDARADGTHLVECEGIGFHPDTHAPGSAAAAAAAFAVSPEAAVC